MKNTANLFFVIIIILIFVVLGVLREISAKIDSVEEKIAVQSRGNAALDDLVDAEVDIGVQAREKQEDKDSIIAGKPFPALEFKDLNGNTVNISKLKGKVVIIDFWATWCGPCLRETPNLLSAYEEFRDKGLEIVGISMDKDRQKLESYLETHKIPWPNYYDGKSWDNEISSRFGIRSIPAIMLLDREGVVRKTRIRGSDIREAVEELISGTMKYPPPQATLPDGDLGKLLEIIEIKPAPPAKLNIGERLTIKFRYDLGPVDNVRIWARPYANGRSVGNYGAHGSSVYRKEVQKTGEAEGWFYHKVPTVVDEVRIEMVDAQSRKTIHTLSEKIDAEWVEKD